MIISRNILVGFLLFFTLFFSLTRHFEIKKMLDDRRKKRIIGRERKGRPEMRDSKLKRG